MEEDLLLIYKTLVTLTILEMSKRYPHLEIPNDLSIETLYSSILERIRLIENRIEFEKYH